MTDSKITKLDIWNLFALKGGVTFRSMKRDEVIMSLSRSVVTYWISQGHIRSYAVRGRGSLLALTDSGKTHLITSTKKWLHNKPEMKPSCVNPHPSFGVR